MDVGLLFLVILAIVIVVVGSIAYQLGKEIGYESGRTDERRVWRLVMHRARELDGEGLPFRDAVADLRIRFRV